LPTVRSSHVALICVSLSLGLLGGCGSDEPSGPGDFPDVRGEWVGQYSVTSCDLTAGTNDFFCDGLFYVGRSLEFSLTLRQSKGNVDGVATQGTLGGSVDGTVDMGGLVTLEGVLGAGDDATTTITDWRTTLVGDSLVGSWSFDVVDNTDSGFGVAVVGTEIVLVGPSVPVYGSCPMEIWLADTDSIDGTLQPPDCQFADESYYDVYAVDVLDGVNYEFAVSSSDFRPFLFVVDLQERLIAAEGNASDSVANFLLNSVADETLLIIANSLYSLEEGSYTVTSTSFGAASVAGMTFERVPIEKRLSRVDAGGISTDDDSQRLARKFVRASGAVAGAKRGGSQ
jgi:hypothetical protein